MADSQIRNQCGSQHPATSEEVSTLKKPKPDTCTSQGALQLLKIMESNCYCLACAKTIVSQHSQFVCLRPARKVWRHLDISRSVWLWIQIQQQKHVLLCKRTGLSGCNLKQPDQKHCTFLPLLLLLPPSSHPFLISFLVPLPDSDTSTKQRLRVKQMLLDVGEILKMLSLCQGCHYVNIWWHMQRKVFTSKNTKTQGKKLSQIKPKGMSVSGTTKCLTFWGSALPVAYSTSSSFFIPDPKL